ncbi:MAG: 2-amino-4-hydroxy-6-hydroxymethyldihydropteridine diphosphokinase [Bacteroidia bacterium]
MQRTQANIFIGLGTNLGDRAGNLKRVIRLIEDVSGIWVIAISSCYETSAWGKIDQPDFLNQVLELKTSLKPNALLDELLRIEREMGRIRTEHWGPRIIDLDILLWDQEIVALEQLKIPHPYLHERIFVLQPLADLAGTVKHPVLKKTIADLLAACPDSTTLKRYDLDTLAP